MSPALTTFGSRESVPSGGNQAKVFLVGWLNYEAHVV